MYTITYDAFIRKPETPGTVEYKNDAQLIADTIYYADTISDSVTFTADAGGIGDYSKVYVRLLKADKASQATMLGGAKFNVYYWENSKWVNIGENLSTCDENGGNHGESSGELILGQYPDKGFRRKRTVYG